MPEASTATNRDEMRRVQKALPEFSAPLLIIGAVFLLIPHSDGIMGYFRRVARRSIMEQGSVFKINRSQAVRLPKALVLPDDVKRVDVIAIGRTRIITPAGESWDSWFDGEGVTPGFMSKREQLADQAREEI